MSDKDSDLGSMSLSHRLPVSDSSHRLCPSTAFGDMSQLSGKWNMCPIKQKCVRQYPLWLKALNLWDLHRKIKLCPIKENRVLRQG